MNGWILFFKMIFIYSKTKLTKFIWVAHNLTIVKKLTNYIDNILSYQIKHCAQKKKKLDGVDGSEVFNKVLNQFAMIHQKKNQLALCLI